MKATLPILSVFVAISTLFGDNVEASPLLERRAAAALNPNPGTYAGAGTSGVAAMHMVVTAPNKIVFIDKVNKNPLRQKNGDPAISTEYDIGDKSLRVLDLKTNTFCSAGAFTGDGTLVHTGGTGEEQGTKHKSGFQSIRLFKPCQDKKCQWDENPNGLSTKRWYPSMVSLSDGRVLILGGSTKATGINNEEINNPTVEFFPGKSKALPFPFLKETLPRNLYPGVHLIAGPANQKRLFVFANVQSIIWDWGTNKIIKRLPNIPGNSRSYPSTGTSVTLPLDPKNNYTTSIMVCGGGGKDTSVETPADKTCGTINLSDKKPDWVMEDFGGRSRIMPDVVILADGKIMYLNGAGTGVAGFNSFNKETQKAKLVADKAATIPVLYDPKAKAGKRFTSLANAGIPRMYHSVATLIPNGNVFISGSNPNNVVRTQKDLKFPTEYRNQVYKPPYFFKGVPSHKITSVAGKTKLNKGAIPVKYKQIVKVKVETTTTDVNFTGALIHFGFVTHSTHMSQRYVFTTIKKVKLISNAKTKVFELDVEMPPNGNMMPPGPHHYLYINNKGVPASTAIEVNIQK